ncbi:hypothetical protein [Lactococcus lactis]|uniref:Terminase n=1 Tax=Lactococcus lactis subsp. lactis A12 TaxID=1137134 RepID=S6FG18_LACLL|nr:hypothetical protein [Lactococcus lactis]CDG04236.1 Putative uncharacterized protein [Lactococcus lactis subsp. lactis A12]SBW30145.1 Putative uncharacterized protein [Lactococcus lactis subsp. lactis]
MAKDGTQRGGRRARSGERSQPLVDKVAAGKKATRMEFDLPDVELLVGEDIGEGVELEGNDYPEPSAYLSAKQKDGTVLGADEIYNSTFQWLKDRGCEQLVAPRMVESYAQNFARFVQCENALSQYGLLGKHPTTKAVMASPFVAMSQNFQKQANVTWYEIQQIVKENASVEYMGDPNTDAMERLLRSRNS